MYIHGMKFSLEVVSIKVKSFMKIKRKGFVMKGGETHSPPGSVSRVNVSSSLLALYWPSTGCLLAFYWPSTGRLLVVYWFLSQRFVKTTS